MTYRFIVHDPTLSVNKDDFKNQVNENILTSEVGVSNRLFEIFGYEQLELKFKLFIKIKMTRKQLRQYRR